MNKRKKKPGLLFLLLCTVLLTACSGSEEEAEVMMEKETELHTTLELPYDEPLPEDYCGTLTTWGWDETYFKMMSEAFQEHYPNVEFKFVKIQNKNVVQRYETELIMGGELPDLAWAIVDTRGEAFELDMWEALEQEPYCFQLADVYEYIHPHMVNANGNVCGIEQSLSPAGLAYRRDLAKKYLGTDEPEELEKLLPDWETFMEKGKEVYNKSNGQVCMWAGIGDVRQFLQEQVELPWVQDQMIDVEAVFGRTLRLICSFRDEHISDDLVAWTPAWYAALQENSHIFLPCATWSVKSIEYNDLDGRKKGRWGLMGVPEGNVSWGGTAMGITKMCKDKRLAWEFLKFATLSTEGAEILNSMGLMTAAKRPYEVKPELKSYKSGWFGEQDIGVYYMDKIIPNIKTRALTAEDGVIFERLGLLSNVLDADRNMTADEALNTLRSELRREFPDLTVQ